jgi:hypothetical protein
MNTDPCRSDFFSESQLRKLLNSSEIFGRLWRSALPYLDTRQNETHTRLSVGLAFLLLVKRMLVDCSDCAKICRAGF